MGLLDKILNNIPEENTNPESVAHQGLLRKALGSISNEKDGFCDKDAHTKPEKDGSADSSILGKNTGPDFYQSKENESVFSNENDIPAFKEQSSQINNETNNSSLPCHSLLKSAEKFLSSSGQKDNELFSFFPDSVDTPAGEVQHPDDEEKKPVYPESEHKLENIDYDSEVTYSDTDSLDFSKIVSSGSPLADIYIYLDYISEQCYIEKIALVSIGEISPETGRINFSKKLDITTTERFSPDITFLNSIAETGKLTYITDFSFLTGFFSNREYNSLKKIYILKIDNNNWIFFIDSYLSVKKMNLKKLENSINEILDNLKIPFDLTSSFVNTNINIKNSASIPMYINSALNDGMVCNLFKLNFNDYLNKFKNNFAISELINLYNEILSKIKLIIGTGGIVNKLDDFNFIICLFSKQELDAELYLQQLEDSLKPYIGQSFTGYFELISSETTEDKQKIISYISKGI